MVSGLMNVSSRSQGLVALPSVGNPDIPYSENPTSGSFYSCQFSVIVLPLLFPRSSVSLFRNQLHGTSPTHNISRISSLYNGVGCSL